MARKAPKTYTAEQLKEIKGKLIEHRGNLISAAEVFLKQIQKDPIGRESILMLREQSEFLVFTSSAISNINLSIDAAERTGPRMLAFEPTDCGIEL